MIFITFIVKNTIDNYYRFFQTNRGGVYMKRKIILVSFMFILFSVPVFAQSKHILSNWR